MRTVLRLILSASILSRVLQQYSNYQLIIGTTNKTEPIQRYSTVVYRPPPHPPAARAEEELMRLKSSAAMKSSKTSTVVA